MFSSSSASYNGPASPPPRPPPPRNRHNAGPNNDMNFKAFTGGGGGDSSSNSFAAARALFEAAKKPENRAMAAAAANNPVVRNAAISAAKNPTTRNMMVNAAASYGNQQQSSSSAPSLPAKPSLAPKPVSRDYGASRPAPAPSLYDTPPSVSPARPSPRGGVYPDIMSELKSLNIGNPPAPSQPGWTQFSSSPPSRPPPVSVPVPSPTGHDPHGIVKYPYKGSHFDELSCDTGDTILLKKEVDTQWIYGMSKSTGKFGIFPISFLDIKIPLVPSSVAATTSPLHSATALYDYASNEPGDLTFYANAHIRVLERVSEEWLEGECDGRRGVFPSNFVSCPSLSSVPWKASPPPPPPPPVTSPGETVLASYDYNSGVAGDLVFHAGDAIEVLERLPDGEWLRGRLHGRSGLVPLTYVSPSAFSPSASGHSSSKFPPGTPVNPPRQVTAMADHHSTDPECLYFSRGDQIVLTEIVNGEWAKGKLAEFKTLPAGYFPRSLANC